MANLNLNGEFRNRVQNMVIELIQNPNQVRLIVRLNQDDDRIWEYNSLPDGQTVVPGGGSAHAEEVMIANWQDIINNEGDQVPEIVEIFLSMSPCIDRSPRRNIGGREFEAGCANKLASLIRDNPGAEWRICFFNYYQEGTRTDAQAYTAPAIMETVSLNADVHKFSERGYHL